MCGIAGFSGGFAPDMLATMGQRIAHRGPDDAGIWYSAEFGIGFAHRRLSIIDTSPAGHQPMEYRGHHLVYNGEIYNFKELRAELEGKGHTFRGNSDSEVLLHGWVEWGELVLDRLNGIYALALWNGERKELTLVRDPIGVKPLYYVETSGGFVFSSELKAFLAVPNLDRSIDPQAVDAYLSFLWAPAPLTMFRAVRKLPPGETMVVRDSRIIRRSRFTPPPFSEKKLNISPQDASERLRILLAQAVERQMVADVPVGAFLSGGLDSSAIVAMACRHVGDIPCFTIGFRGQSLADEGFADDLPYARQVARHTGVVLHEVRMDADLIHDLEQMVWQLDEPQADPAPLQAGMICRAARDAGIKVLLSGAGGDDIFTGYRRHRALRAERWWRWLPQPVRASMQRMAGVLPQGSSTGRRVSRAFRFAGEDDDARLIGYFHWLDRARRQNLYTSGFRAQLADAPSLLQATLDTLPAGTTPLQRMLYMEMRHFLADHNLNYTDKMGMAYGVEVRVPLLDPDLVAFACRLPDGYKQHGNIGKWIFKKAMEPLLPHGVIYRPKTGFGAPVRRWLHHDLREMVGDLLSDEAIKRRGWLDASAVRRLIADDAAGRVDAAYPIFSLLCMELWCRRFLDGRA